MDMVHSGYHVGVAAGDLPLSPSSVLGKEEITVTKTSGQYVVVNWIPDRNWVDDDGGDAAVNAGIKQAALNVAKYAPKKVFIVLNHEPNNNVSPQPGNSCPGKGSSGSPADFRNMYANVEKIFNEGMEQPTSNGRCFCEGYKPLDCWDASLYPGNSLIDWIGDDVYGTNHTNLTGKPGSGNSASFKGLWDQNTST